YWGGRNAKFSSEPQRVWFERMRDKGWTVPDWPKEYGGGGLDRAEHKVLREEMSAMGARSPLSSFGIWMLGPALLKYGNEAQKKEHLPKIAAGLIRWCQGYSEPNAGSDLASLQTRAESDGDDYIINGQKIWTSYANYADWIFCLVRTDATAKKHDGISFILFDMASKGVSTRPILLISGYSPFCETFFDNVRVPKSHVVGTVNRGWDVAKYLLQHERAMISGMGERGVGRPLGQVAADSVGSDEGGRLDDAMLRGTRPGMTSSENSPFTQHAYPETQCPSSSPKNNPCCATVRGASSATRRRCRTCAGFATARMPPAFPANSGRALPRWAFPACWCRKNSA